MELVSPAPGLVLPASGHLLHARQLAFGYRGHALCAPVDLTVDAGEAVFVVGMNGVGKSTFLRTCLGLLPSVGGQVHLVGEQADPASPRQRAAVSRDLGQESFFPALSVREHLSMVCWGHGVAAGASLDDLLAEFELTMVGDVVPTLLSSGQRRRLALAAALARPRSLLVLDEPEQHLDVSARAALAGRLHAERLAGGGLLVVSHDPDLVATCATAVLLLGRESRLLSVDEGVEALEEGR